MPKINCLESAKKAYQNDVDNADIEATYDALARHKKMAEDVGSNVFEDLNSFSKEVADEQERAAKIGMYQSLLKGQVLADNLMREELFRQAGHKPQNSVPRSLIGKMVGSTWRVARNKENTWTKQQIAVDKFTASFAKDLQKDLLPYFTSKDGQKELAEAMFALKDGREVNTPFGKLASIFLKYQDLAIEKNKEVGIFINKLDNRISPNIHNAEKITGLSWGERKQANTLYPNAPDPHYEYTYQRWKSNIRQKLDDDRTFVKNNVDPHNEAQVDSFLREAYDNIINKGKSSQTNVNYANKFKQQRVLHWKDAQSLVDYNTQFGSGSLQDSIFKELSHQFGMVEVMRDWTINPMDAVDSTLELMDKNPAIKQRFEKGKEYKKIRDLMKNMTTREYPDYGAIATIANGLKTYEAATKLGMAMPTSVDDLANTSRVARELGYNRFQTYGGVIKRFVMGLSKEEKELYSGLVNTGIATKLSQANRFNMNPYSPRSVLGWANHWTYKLNLLERWDNANKGYVTSIVGKFLASNRHVDWEAMTDHDKAILDSYNITSNDWNLIRKSTTRVSKDEHFIMPDTIQDVPDAVVADSLRSQGIENPSALRIAQYKDALERKMTLFFRDRANSAIVSPDIVDREMLTFGVQNKVIQHALGWMMQFKHYGLAWVRKSLLPVLRENGATSTWEGINPFSGKANWAGMGQFAAERLFLAYVGLSLKNLALGNSPPLLNKLETWTKMVKQTLGPLELAFNVNFHPNLYAAKQSLGGFLLGAAGTDVLRVGELLGNLYGEHKAGMGYNKTKHSTYQLVKNGIPFNAVLTKWLTNHFFLDGLEDWAYPNKRQNDLQQLQQNTGSTKLF